MSALGRLVGAIVLAANERDKRNEGITYRSGAGG